MIPGYLFIALAVILLVTTLRRVTKKEKFTARDRAAPIILLGVGFLYVIALAFHSPGEIQLPDKIQILLMFGLVAVTSFYAWSASRQADASVKMAEEMREQRYDAVRPVIDIQRDTARADVDRRGLEAAYASSRDASLGLSCILHNIGLGPAIDVYSFFQNYERKRRRWDFGTLATGGRTERTNLSLKHKGNRMALVAYYKDVYDRVFESSRKVRIEKTPNPHWVIGPLKIVRVKKVGEDD